MRLQDLIYKGALDKQQFEADITITLLEKIRCYLSPKDLERVVIAFLCGLL